MNPDVLKAVTARYAVSITDHVAGLMQGEAGQDPIATQYIPQARELTTLPEELSDPIGDEAHSPVKGIVHRYPDRVLFKPVQVCAVYCRYCFRREHVGPSSGVLKPEERTAALDYIRSHPEIWEVILTGGDPLVLSVRQLQEIIGALETIPHVQVIRIHTRVPLADPVRITPQLCDMLRACTKPLYMAVHVNHVQELSPEVHTALKILHESGVVLLSQSVLLKGINDSAEVLEALFRALVARKVKPYYLHHPDLAAGTSHFRVSIAEGQALMQALQGRVSGVCLPTYMLDIPAGHGKVPLTPCYIAPDPQGGYQVTDYRGTTHLYAPETERRAENTP